jgi:hypothetical protein
MPRKAKPETPKTLLQRVDAFLDEQGGRDERAEALIEEYIDMMWQPGFMPRAIARQCTIDTRAAGYSYPAALQAVKRALETS